MSLGTCERKIGNDPRSEAMCAGPLCFSGRMVACERCGHEHPGHPAMADASTPEKARPDAVITPVDFGFSTMDRLLRLEKEVVAMKAELASLRERPARKGG